MPVYEYLCDACQGTTEAIRRMADMDAPIACEHCGSDKTRRALSLFMTGSAAKKPAQSPAPPGGCGRCGDPRGSCG